MSRYDGLIIPRSYSEYINKTDAATLSQALQLGGVLDSAPTEDSVKAVKSGGVFNALAGKQPTLTFDNVPTEDSANPVKSGGIYNALATKQDTLTFDDAPTVNSNNPVKSGGIKNAIYITTAESLIHQLVVTTTDTSYQTFSQRKITDYKLLLFEIGTNDSIRITQFIYAQDFIYYANAYFNSAHGSNLENISSMETHYVDATHLRFKAGGAAAFTTVNVIGFR